MEIEQRQIQASVVRRMGQAATQDRRAARVTVGVESTARELAGHIEFMHGGIQIPITAIAKRSRGKDPDLEELAALHDRLHEQAAHGEHIMRFAHHHDPDFDAGGVKR
jgi:hypothetical protein